MPHFIFIQQISVLNILNMLYNLHFFSLQNAVHFIMLPCLVSVITHILNTGCAKIWKKKSVATRFKITFETQHVSVSVLELREQMTKVSRVRFPVSAHFSCPLRLGPLGTYPTSYLFGLSPRTKSPWRQNDYLLMSGYTRSLEHVQMYLQLCSTQRGPFYLHST